MICLTAALLPQIFPSGLEQQCVSVHAYACARTAIRSCVSPGGLVGEIRRLCQLIPAYLWELGLCLQIGVNATGHS